MYKHEAQIYAQFRMAVQAISRLYTEIIMIRLFMSCDQCFTEFATLGVPIVSILITMTS